MDTEEKLSRKILEAIHGVPYDEAVRGELKKEEIVYLISKLMPLDKDDSEIDWKKLCFFTSFDSTVTAIAYGLNWEKNIKKAKKSQLMMALVNLIEFPNDGNKSRRPGYGLSTETINTLLKFENKNIKARK